jgi:hypothetical protein
MKTLETLKKLRDKMLEALNKMNAYIDALESKEEDNGN